MFYRDSEGNGLVLKEEPFQQTDDCGLCGKVGTSAAVVGEGTAVSVGAGVLVGIAVAVGGMTIRVT